MLRLRSARRGFFRIRHSLAVDCEVRAVHPAQIAAAALFRRHYVRRGIALGIESGGERQNFGRTEFDAESARFTALHDNGNSSLCHQEPPKECCHPKLLKLWQPASQQGVMAITICSALAHRGLVAYLDGEIHTWRGFE